MEISLPFIRISAPRLRQLTVFATYHGIVQSSAGGTDNLANVIDVATRIGVIGL